MAFAAALFSAKRDLMMLQQNSNRNDRYLRWMKQSGDSTRISRLVAFVAMFMAWVAFIPSVFTICIIALVGAWNFLSLFIAKYKKPLIFTKRATRIYSVAVLLIILTAGGVAVARGGVADDIVFAAAVALTGCYAVSYWFILAANWLLKPVEKHINKRYYDEAASILASMPQLKVIGITGSYGKTSTKHYLYRILSEQYDVLMTPGNFNTTLGVIRTVREHLKPYNEVFIAEMGAKQPNDIKEICDLVHPTIGIITAVGPQHLESFKTIETVQATKFELADALPADGLVVVNNDFEFIANRKVGNVACARYAVNPNHKADYHATDIEYTSQGTYFTISNNNGEKLRLFTHLVGECNVSNLMAAVIVAKHLGVSDDKIRYAIEKIEQVEHRLNLKRTGGGITIIDDAYNSNPVGSAMALDVLAGMKQGKRIIITPGMIELGDDQYRLNRDFGEKIAKSVDVAIIVGEYNRDAIIEGIEAGGMSEDKVHKVSTFNEAQQLMLTMAKAGDTVLYENDLPDTFK